MPLVEDSSILEGIGLDVFIRKARPGSYIGGGYIVDVYQNGIKIDTIHRDTKKEVMKLLDDYKKQYGTTKAYQNEIQYHITYKIKDYVRRESMEHSDPLFAKVARVQELLYRLIDPSVPVKVRIAANDVVKNTFSALPETPPVPPQAGGEENAEMIAPSGDPEEVNETNLINVIIQQVVQYFVDVAPNTSTGKAEWPKKDDLYNTLKKWFSTIRRRIKDYMTTNNVTLDLNRIATEVAKVLHSGDPKLLSKIFGKEVTPDVAAKIAEITSLKLGGDAELRNIDMASGALGKRAAVSLDTIKRKLLKFVNEDDDVFRSEDTELSKYLDRLDRDDVGIVHNIISNKKNRNHSEQALKSYLDEFLLKDTDKVRVISSHVNDFWKYVSGFYGVGTLDEVFASWLSKKNIDVVTAQNVYDSILKEINDRFAKRNATVNESERSK